MHSKGFVANLPQPVAHLHRLLEQEAATGGPTSFIEITQPKNPDGFWHLDFSTKAGRATVQWNQARGFGVSTWVPGEDPLKGLFENPEHTAATPQEAFEKIQAIIGANIAGPGCDPGLD